MSNLDPQTERNQARGLAFMTAGFIGIAGVTGLFVSAITEDEPDPIAQYMEGFTADGKCLDGTVYDPAEGATVLVVDRAEPDALIVVPKDHTSLTPAVLHFVLEANGSFDALNPRSAGYATGDLLVQAGCLEGPSGY